MWFTLCLVLSSLSLSLCDAHLDLKGRDYLDFVSRQLLLQASVSLYLKHETKLVSLGTLITWLHWNCTCLAATAVCKVRCVLLNILEVVTETWLWTAFLPSGQTEARCSSVEGQNQIFGWILISEELWSNFAFARRSCIWVAELGCYSKRHFKHKSLHLNCGEFQCFIETLATEYDRFASWFLSLETALELQEAFLECSNRCYRFWRLIGHKSSPLGCYLEHHKWQPK